MAQDSGSEVCEITQISEIIHSVESLNIRLPNSFLFPEACTRCEELTAKCEQLTDLLIVKPYIILPNMHSSLFPFWVEQQPEDHSFGAKK